MLWDEMRRLWEEGSLHRTKRQAQAALAASRARAREDVEMARAQEER